MNSSKNIMKGQNGNRGGRSSDLEASDRKKIFLGVICVVIAAVLCIGVGIQSFQPKTVLTVGSEKVSLSEMMYPIYEVESQYNMLNQYYEQYGTSVWDMNYQGSDSNVSSSASMADGLKQELVDREAQYIILSKEAEKAGVKLTSKEKKKAASDAADALVGLTMTQKAKLDISKRKLTKRFETRALSDKYGQQNRKKTDKTVDEDSVKKNVKKSDYKQYDVQYYYFSVNKTTKKGKTKKLSQKKIDKRLSQLKEARYTALDESNDVKFKNIAKNSGLKKITYNKASFTEKDGWSFVQTKSVLNKIKALDKGEVSEIYEDENAGNYLFVKMKDNTSEKSYNEAVETALDNAKDTAYNNWYEGVAKNYSVKVNNKVWKDVTIGSTTTNIVTLQDLQKIQQAKATPAPTETPESKASTTAAAATKSPDSSEK